MRPQQQRLVQIEGVLVVPRRMAFWNVECFEVVVIALDLGTNHHLEAHPDKDVRHLTPKTVDGMERPDR